MPKVPQDSSGAAQEAPAAQNGAPDVPGSRALYRQVESQQVPDEQPKVERTLEDENLQGFLQQVIREDFTRLNSTLEKGQKLDPKFGARVTRLRMQLPAPADYIAENLETLENLGPDGIRGIANDLYSAPFMDAYVRQDQFFASSPPDEIRRLVNVEKILSRPRLLRPTPKKVLMEQAKRQVDFMIKSNEVNLLRTKDVRLEEQLGGGVFDFGFLGDEDVDLSDEEFIEKVREQEVQKRFNQLVAIEDYISGTGKAGFVETFQKIKALNEDWFMPWASGFNDGSYHAFMWNAMKKEQAGEELSDFENDILIQGRLM